MQRSHWFVLTLAAAATGSAFAQAYPNKVIRLQVPFAPGGTTDIIARVIAEPLGKELGQPVVVEARPGAGGNLASGQVARAAADGYTLVLLTGGHAVSAAMYKSLSFNPLEDFEWVSVVTRFPFVLAAKAGSPYNNVSDVLKAAKASPGTISFSSVGVGSTQHLAGELLQSMTGTKLNHIPYKGGAAPLQDVLGGRVDLMFDSVTATRAQVEAGKLHALAVTSLDRSPLLPAVPPLQDTVPGYEVTSWSGLAAPKGTPPEVTQRLHAALLKVLKQPAVVQQLQATGGVISPSNSGAEMKQYVKGQIEKWLKVMRDAQIQPR